MVSTLKAFTATLFTVTAGGQAKYATGFGPQPTASRTSATTTWPAEAAFAEEGGDDICAVILEPMQGEGGMIPRTPEFAAARRLATTTRCSSSTRSRAARGAPARCSVACRRASFPTSSPRPRDLAADFDRRNAYHGRNRQRILGRRSWNDVRRQSTRLRRRRGGVRHRQHHRSARRVRARHALFMGELHDQRASRGLRRHSRRRRLARLRAQGAGRARQRT